MYSLDQIIAAFTPSSPGFMGILISFALAMGFGLLDYIWAVAINIKEHKTPFPVWAHTFYFAYDFTCCVVMSSLALKTHFFWLFTVFAIGNLLWTIMEAINIYSVIKYEKEEAFGSDCTDKQAILYIILQVAFMFAVVNIFRWNMQDVAMFCWLPLTNVLMAVIPGVVIHKRRSREGSSVALCIIVLFGTIFNFLPAPIGLFTTVTPQIYNQPIWFAVGVVCVVIAAYNLYRILQLPPKTVDMGNYKKKPIW